MTARKTTAPRKAPAATTIKPTIEQCRAIVEKRDLEKDAGLFDLYAQFQKAEAEHDKAIEAHDRAAFGKTATGAEIQKLKRTEQNTLGRSDRLFSRLARQPVHAYRALALKLEMWAVGTLKKNTVTRGYPDAHAWGLERQAYSVIRDLKRLEGRAGT